MAQYIDLDKHPVDVRLAAHTIGLDHKRPYYRHGKLWYRPYRNYFATHDRSLDNDIWHKSLIPRGYAAINDQRKREDGITLITYNLTRKGIDWLGSVLNVNIHDEED